MHTWTHFLLVFSSIQKITISKYIKDNMMTNLQYPSPSVADIIFKRWLGQYRLSHMLFLQYDFATLPSKAGVYDPST